MATTLPMPDTLFSMMICASHFSASFCITGRVMMSMPPPGAVPTMTRMGLEG